MKKSTKTTLLISTLIQLRCRLLLPSPKPPDCIAIIFRREIAEYIPASLILGTHFLRKYALLGVPRALPRTLYQDGVGKSNDAKLHFFTCRLHNITTRPFKRKLEGVDNNGDGKKQKNRHSAHKTRISSHHLTHFDPYSLSHFWYLTEAPLLTLGRVFFRAWIKSLLLDLRGCHASEL